MLRAPSQRRAHGGASRPAVVAGLVLAAACSATPAPREEPGLESWLDVDPARVQAIDWVPDPDRRGEVRLVDRLSIGDDRPEYAFGRSTPQVVVGPDGSFFVLDVSNDRVLIYDAEGRHRSSFGRSGEGPGEFALGRSGFDSPFGLVGDRILVFNRSSQLSLWTTDGTLAETWSLHRNLLRPGPWVEVGDGTLLAVRTAVLDDNRWVREAVVDRLRLGDEGLEQVERVVAAPSWAGARFALLPDGRMRAAAFDAYKSSLWIVALDRAGSGTWARRYDWSGRDDAVDLAVDGQGRTYVFPRRPVSADALRRPVDVIDPDGDRLMAGWISDIEPRWRWQGSVGHEVYGADLDPASSEWRIVLSSVELPSR